MVLTRGNLIYFNKIEETFEKPSYFLPNPKMRNKPNLYVINSEIFIFDLINRKNCKKRKDDKLWTTEVITCQGKMSH